MYTFSSECGKKMQQTERYHRWYWYHLRFASYLTLPFPILLFSFIHSISKIRIIGGWRPEAWRVCWMFVSVAGKSHDTPFWFTNIQKIFVLKMKSFFIALVQWGKEDELERSNKWVLQLVPCHSWKNKIVEQVLCVVDVYFQFLS